MQKKKSFRADHVITNNGKSRLNYTQHTCSVNNNKRNATSEFLESEKQMVPIASHISKIVARAPKNRFERKIMRGPEFVPEYFLPRRFNYMYGE